METPEQEIILSAARRVWDYHHMGHVPAPADAIFVLGSHDLRVAERAADLYRQGLAPLVILSGGLGRLTATWDKPEAEYFAGIVRAKGVPETAVLIENQSTNTGQNVAFTRQLLARRNLRVQSLIAVQKPYMERRTFATIRRQWPEVELRVTSPLLDFVTYSGGPIQRDEVIHIMVGDLHRIIEYPKRGFAIPQEVPADVIEAFHLLIERGYRNHLLPMPSK
jgi:uncharacterized SAM-binding protein YcdF (DUF218 family)